MSDESESKVKDIIEATTALVKAVPIYKDAIQPAAKEIGHALEIVAKAINAALLPIEGLVWGADKIRDFVHTRVAEKLRNTPPDCIKTPDPAVAGPALESLRYTGHQEALREMYANLLANAIDERTAREAHPGFVEIIRNLNPDEARILKVLATRAPWPCININRIIKKDGTFVIKHKHLSTIALHAGCQIPQLSVSYIGNLERLGLVAIPNMYHLSDDSLYNEIRDHPQVKAILADISDDEHYKAEVAKQGIEVTPLGRQFIMACVVDKQLRG